ncbi:MAG: CopM family metallochaperone [Pseudomonadota bacterium]
MRTKLIAGLAAGTLALGTAVAFAQSHHHGHGAQQKPAAADHSSHGGSKPKGDSGPSSVAFHAINAKMHEGMDITFTGNADVDFVRGMIPHHQGAVDMAKTVLAFGKDPQIRKLAEDIIKAQETEIALMQTWLKQNAK